MALESKRGNRDSGRGSFGLGIVLSNESQESQLDPAVATMGVATLTPSSSVMYGMSLPETTRSSWADSDQQKTAPSIFARFISGISAFMSTTDNNEQFRPKTRIEDMLESYYMSQDRQVPDWVYNPPPDPPQSTKFYRPASIIVDQPRQDITVSQESIEPSRESSTKPSSISTGSALRPFARLNISRLARSGVSTRMRLASPTPSSAPSSDVQSSMARSGSRLRRVWPQQLSFRSGSSRPTSPSVVSRETSAPVNVQMVDSGNESTEDSPIEPTLPQFMIDSSQLSAPSSRSQSPFAKMNRQRNLQVRAGSEVSQQQSAKVPSSDSLSRESRRLEDGKLPPAQSHILNQYEDYTFAAEDAGAYESTANTPGSHRRKLSASLTAWVNPSKWRPKAKTTLTTPVTVAANEHPNIQKYSEPAPEMLASTSNYNSQPRITKSATPRSGRVKRLFKRKHTNNI
ncbi:hypothetical protein IWW36_001097 [Coemansia brasiliensis]|uniref:Uncharacterized protein n=1 Tax=Coemansia brasiliensis TaxID=2650707 RepID=A0A9W8IHD9_9FUNG|nr:hypothetical protein IWW36_001097 [Coemansia brasiliensis]